MTVGAATLLVRSAVALRAQSLAAGEGFYLSLYDEEIDARADAFWAAWGRDTGDTARQPLELTDAAVWAGSDGSVLVARGGAATFPLYWSLENQRLCLSTALPLRAGGRFSRSGLVASVAAACVHGSYEPNGFTETPLADWQRVRRASVVRFAGGRMVEERVLRSTAAQPGASRADIAGDLRAAIDAYAQSQSRIAASVVELSGGFDSTLAAAIPSRAGMRGISVAFPFYEFRFESDVQRATAEFLGVPRTEVDGTDLFPYAPADGVVRFDEPSVYVTGIRHAERVARFAADSGAQRIYNGHGGDQCFATDLLAQEGLVANPPSRGPFTGPAWRSIAISVETMRKSPWMDRSLGTFVYDARPDVWVKETFGATLRTPFADRGVFRAALAWSHWYQVRGMRPDKSILADAAHDLLPQAVLQRKGKVAYDGVWMRAYLQHAEHIAGVFEQVGSILAHIGVSPAWLQRRARELGAWQERSDREVLAAYAIATWLAAWDLRRVEDVDWAD
ncbi:MAG: asparagine synthase C-terminal domain-containing protein [Steroidobacteraceae bacterium]|nr:asparagine synthase C-terminal domain-containing protein [Steroidobacteraceae bacterium]